MGILERINRIVRANVNQLLDMADDPAKGLELHIEEMRGGIREAKKELVEISTNEKIARRKYEQCLVESGRWEQRAMEALRVGDEDLARQALLYKSEIDQKADDFLRQAELSAQYAQQLEDQIAMLERKADLAKQRAKEIAARRAARPVREREQVVRPADLTPLEDRSLFDEFDRVGGDFERLDAQMEAMAELNAQLFDPERVELDRKFEELERKHRVEDGLQRLKRRLQES